MWLRNMTNICVIICGKAKTLHLLGEYVVLQYDQYMYGHLW